MTAPREEALPPLSKTPGETQGVVATEWRGPLPPPSILMEFDKVVHNGAERIMQAWEKETEHRRRLESRELHLLSVDAIFGKIAALVSVLSALLLTGFAVREGAEWAAMILGSGVIGSVSWAFVSTTRSQRKHEQTSSAPE